MYFQAEIGALQKTQEDLQKGKQTLEDMLQKLEREQVAMLWFSLVAAICEAVSYLSHIYQLYQNDK